MLRNYLIVAWRHILKNKLYASINIIGLTVGLSVFILGSLLVDYERNYDVFFSKQEQVFTVGTVFSATAAQDVGVGETDGIYSAYAPLIKTAVPEFEAIARTVRRAFLLSVADDHYYEEIRFVDPALLEIFDFDYLDGDASALDDPSGIVMTRELAEKLFGEVNVVGKTVTLDRDVDLRVTAVIEDLPKNSHFTSSVLTDVANIFVPIAALNRAVDYDVAGNWNNLSMGDLTYLLAPADKDISWVQDRMNFVFDHHFPDRDEDFISSLKVRQLKETNTALFDAIGLPILESIRILGLLVLVVAIVNYTNLATAQSLGRAREVGLRKTMGADRSQLLIQFLVESLCIVAIAMLISLALLEVVIPQLNEAADRGLSMNYQQTLPWLVITTLVVGIVSGAYPSYLITRASPITALHESSRGGNGSLFRNLMLGLQFTISIFMLAMVMIVFFQNKKVEDASNLYPRSQILTLTRLDVESIRPRLETVRNELMNIPGVQNVTYSSQLPYEQSNSSFVAGATEGDEDSSFMLMQVRVDENFLTTYDIPLLAGRDVDLAVGADTIEEGDSQVNVIVNEMALSKLGFGSPSQALGQVFYDFPDERDGRGARAYTIVGVVPDQNFQGFHNKIKPMTFNHRADGFRVASVRVSGIDMDRALSEIENVWDDLVPDYPMQSQLLDDTFADTFAIYSAMMKVLAGFAAIALTLSMIGLFGLAAFMAQTRTREIGIRKVMGASIPQIVRLLVWQFSKPVMWSLLVALPLTYFASSAYLNFFADRIEMPAGIIVISGLAAVLFAWVVVSMHAIRVAKANPIRALRYE